jgi:hypothetical protein
MRDVLRGNSANHLDAPRIRAQAAQLMAVFGRADGVVDPNGPEEFRFRTIASRLININCVQIKSKTGNIKLE